MRSEMSECTYTSVKMTILTYNGQSVSGWGQHVRTSQLSSVLGPLCTLITYDCERKET